MLATRRLYLRFPTCGKSLLSIPEQGGKDHASVSSLALKRVWDLSPEKESEVKVRDR